MWKEVAPSINLAAASLEPQCRDMGRARTREE